MKSDSLLASFDGVFADLDGVVYAGANAIPHAVASLNAARGRMPVYFLTNNASRTPAAVAQQLRDLGVETQPDHVITSPEVAIEVLNRLIQPGSSVFVVGGDGIESLLRAAGYRPTRSAEDSPSAVVQGFAPDVNWRELAEASFALQGDAGASLPWIATNMDWTIPVARGVAPGNGTLVSAVHTATGRMPQVVGKPDPAIFHEARRRSGCRRPLMLGDRLDTDILGARRAELPAAAVLTGVDGPKQLLAASPESRPDYILADLRGLYDPYPPVTRIGGGVRVGQAECRIERHELRCEMTGSRLDQLRAACLTVWESGVPIHSLRVPPELLVSV